MTFRPQTKWETSVAQVDLIGRSVELPGAEGFGTQGCGFGTITAFRRTNQGPQVKVERLYEQGVEIHFLNTLRGSQLPETVAKQF